MVVVHEPVANAGSSASAPKHLLGQRMICGKPVPQLRD
jgi:hypothetical protein